MTALFAAILSLAETVVVVAVTPPLKDLDIAPRTARVADPGVVPVQTVTGHRFAQSIHVAEHREYV